MVWHYPGALFFGAGGCHHHLGTNTWAGRNARSAGDGDARLLEWAIELHDTQSLDAAENSLRRAGVIAERETSAAGAPEVVTRDPWRTQIRLR